MKVFALFVCMMAACGISHAQCTPPPGYQGCAVLGGIICGGVEQKGSCPIIWVAQRSRYCTGQVLWCEWDVSGCPQCAPGDIVTEPDTEPEASLILPDKWNSDVKENLFLPIRKKE